MEYVVLKNVNLYDSETPGTGKILKVLKASSVVIVQEIKKIGRRSIKSEAVERAKIIAPFEGWCNVLTYKGEPLIQPVVKSASSFSDAIFRTNRFYYGDVGNDTKFSSFSLGLAVNDKVIVYPKKDGGLGVLPLNITKNYVEKSSHDERRGTYGVVDYSSAPKTLKIDNVIDFGFDPFCFSHLSTLHVDGVVRTWNMDLDDVKEDIITPKALSEIEKCAGSYQLRYHPSAKDVCAVGKNICDIASSKVVMSCFDEDMIPEPIGWEYDGRRLFGAKHNALFWADPRTKEKAGSMKLKLHAEFVMAGGEFEMLLTGYNNLKDRIVTCYDIRNMEEPIATKYIKDHKLDPIIPLYDSDTKLLWVGFKNDHILQLYDLNDVNDNGFVPLNVDQKSQLGVEYEAMAMPPKTCFGNKEFGHIIKLTNNDKIYQTSISLDVKPFTGKKLPKATLNVEDWLSGKNGAPAVNRRSRFLKERKDDGARKQRSLYHHLGIYEPQIKDAIYDCPVWKGCLPCGKNVKVNRDYVVFTAKTIGPGSLGIVKTTKTGRMGNNLKCIKSHPGQPIFDVSNFSNLVLTTGVDCKAHMWRIPDEIKTDITKPDVSRSLEGRPLFAGFHPYVAGIGFTSNKHFGKCTLRMFDGNLKDIWATSLEYDVLNVAFHPLGYLLSLCCSDNVVRVLDIRNQKIVTECKPEEMTKPNMASSFWLDESRVLVIGHRKGSVIGISIWNIFEDEQLMGWELDKSNSTPIGHWDPDAKIFYQAYIGEMRIRMYEIKEKSAKETGISRTVRSAIRGMAFVSKHDVDIKNVELNKAFTLGDGIVNPISFKVPRKRKAFFQDDLYTDTRAREPMMSTSDFIAGKEVKPVFVSLAGDMVKLSVAPPEELTDRERKALAKKAEMELKNRDENEAKEGDIARSWDRMMGGVMATFDHSAPRVGEIEVDDGIDSDEWSE